MPERISRFSYGSARASCRCVSAIGRRPYAFYASVSADALIGKGVHELRFRDRAGIYRVIYVLLGANEIWLLHAFIKKTDQTPKQNIELVQKRLKEVR